MKYFIILALAIVFQFTGLQPVLAQEAATVYFFRPSPEGNDDQIRIFHGKWYVDRILPQTAVRYVCGEGEQVFSAVTQEGSDRTLTLNLKAGGTYYVRVVMIRNSDMAGLQPEVEATAKAQVEKMPVQTVRNMTIPAAAGLTPKTDSATQRPAESKPKNIIQIISPPAPVMFAGSKDTLDAVTKLFALKRKGGKQRRTGFLIAMCAFSALAVVGMQNTTTDYDPSSNSIKTTNTPDGTMVGIGMIGATIMIPISVSGITQSKKFNAGKQEEVTSAYRAGNPLPDWVKKSLKPIHFAR